MSFAPLPNFQPSYLQGYVPKGTSVWEKVLAGAVGAGVNEAASSGVSALMSKYIDDPEAEARLDEIRARIGLLGAQKTALSEKPIPSDFDNERTRQLFLENNLSQRNFEESEAKKAEILEQARKEKEALASPDNKAADDGKTWFDNFMQVKESGKAAVESESNLFNSAKEIWSNPESSAEQKAEAAKILNRELNKNSEDRGEFKLSRDDTAWLHRFSIAQDRAKAVKAGIPVEPDEPKSLFDDHYNYLFGPR